MELVAQIPLLGLVIAYAALLAALCGVGVLAWRLAVERRRLGAESTRNFELARDAICISGSDGRLRRVNPAFEEALGYREDELLGRRLADLVHPEDRARADAVAVAVATGDGPVRLENRWLDRRGEVRWMEWTSENFPEEGIVHAVARDVTERKQLELELERISQRDPLTGVSTVGASTRSSAPGSWTPGARSAAALCC
jgi:PAS domain S-box-containing protein